MEWIKVKKAEYSLSEEVNEVRGTKYNLYLSPHSITPDEEGNDTEVLIVRNLPSVSTYDVKRSLIELQEQYDSSDEVNVFYIQGEKQWLDKATRVGLVNSLNVKKATGADTIELWLGKQKLTVPIAAAEQFLQNLELYAMQCYNITAQHLAEIKAISDRKQLMEYDITKDYPEPLTLSI